MRRNNCKHKKVERGLNSSYYGDNFDLECQPLGGYKYTYKCLICGQKFAFDRPYKKFDKLIIERTVNFNEKHFS